jgi:hypothetical protein
MHGLRFRVAREFFALTAPANLRRRKARAEEIPTA